MTSCTFSPLRVTCFSSATRKSSRTFLFTPRVTVRCLQNIEDDYRKVLLIDGRGEDHWAFQIDSDTIHPRNSVPFLQAVP